MNDLTRFLWIDVETTGLSAQEDLLLEVAAWPSRSADPLDLDPRDMESWVIGHDGSNLGRHLDHVTWGMHGKSGLLAEVVSSSHTYQDIQENLLRMTWLDPACVWHLAGNSVHFDRDFLKRCCPEVIKRCSHKLLDVSSLLLTAKCPLVGVDLPKVISAHRAQDDIRQSVKLFTELLSVLRGH